MERALYLGRDRVLVRANWGGYMVVPATNVDVAVGVVRDGIIEPWTTRLVQELLKPGHVVINGGANFGYYAVLASQIVGSEGLVIAVEANPHILPYLLLTRHWAGFTDRMKVVHRALWHEAEVEMRFSFDPQYLGGGGIEGVSESIDEALFGSVLEDAIWSPSNALSLTDRDGYVATSRRLKITNMVTTTTVDAIAPTDRPVDLIHLDIEGAESFALLGARKTIERSPGIRLVTEWASQQIAQGEARRAAEVTIDFLSSLGFRPRHLVPRLADDGALNVSGYLDREQMLNYAEHGDYIWLRPQNDPWS